MTNNKHFDERTENVKAQMIDHLILKGASLAMMMELSSISRSEFEKRQLALGISSSMAGRPKALTKQQELFVLKLWNKYSDLKDIERYQKIGMETQISLKQVWAFIKQGVSAPVSRKTSETAPIHKLVKR